MNKVFLTGNLTREVEVRYTQSGKAFARCGIAVKRPFSKDKDIDFFNLVAWEKNAEFLGKYMQKGSRVLIEGRLQTSSYEDKQGVKHNDVEVVVDNVEFAGGKRDTSDAPKRKPKDDFDGEDVNPDDTPF